VADPDRRDAAGRKPRGRIIDEEGPEGYASTLPLADIAAALARAGIAADGSNDAGDYVCNHVFYRLMADIAGEGKSPARIGGFVHVPVPRAGTAMTEDRLAEAAFIIVRACAAERGPYAPPRILKERALWTGKGPR
jgi:pyroglutamyl-peptidase